MNQNFQRRDKIRRTAATITFALAVIAILVLDHLKHSASTTASNLSATPAPTSQSSDPASTAATSSSANSAPSTSSTSSSYKDGTYTATAQYSVPHSYESIEVSLTVKNGVVTSSQIQNSEGDPKSAQFQEAFASEYQSYVTGKSLSGLNLNIVAGASDTTQGFNQAVQSIRSQAQA